ncbi:MAG: NAD(+) synthase, partial [Synergistaceae bacterium]|nr:NAD(+) synthase [Synergistaceae bacterium]
MTQAIDGYVRVAAATPSIRVADCAYNAERILDLMRRAAEEEVGLLCLPELCITGYTCGDLFLQRKLLNSALDALSYLVAESASSPLAVVAGLPFPLDGQLFNVAAVFGGGRLFGIVPKANLPNYGEFYELRHFLPAQQGTRVVRTCGSDVPMGTKLIFRCESEGSFRFAAEICEDLWIPAPPSCFHAMAGALVIVNSSASDETIGKSAYRRQLAAIQSGRLVCGYVYSNAGHGESSTDMVFSGHNLICENGALLAESPPFGGGWTVSDIDIRALEQDRRRMNTWRPDSTGYSTIEYLPGTRPLSNLRRRIDPCPFVPSDESERNARCEAILDMQVAGLEKRLEHTNSRTAVVGISGGLDSCLALLVTSRAMVKLGRPMSDIMAVTMPCFGT